MAATTCLAAHKGLIAAAGDDGVIHVMRVIDNRLVSCCSLHGHGVKNMTGVTDLRFGSGGELISCAGDGTIRVWR